MATDLGMATAPRRRAARSLALAGTFVVAMAWPLAGGAAAEDQPGWRVSIQLRVKGQPVELATDVRCVAHEAELAMGGPEIYYAPEPMSIGTRIDADTAVAVVVPYVCGKEDKSIRKNWQSDYLPMIGLIDLRNDAIDLYLSRQALTNPAEPINFLGWTVGPSGSPHETRLDEYGWFHAPEHGERPRCYYGYFAIRMGRERTPVAWPFLSNEALTANALSFSWAYSSRYGGQRSPGLSDPLTAALLGWGIPPSPHPSSPRMLGLDLDPNLVVAAVRRRGLADTFDITDRRGVIRYYGTKDCALPLPPIAVGEHGIGRQPAAPGNILRMATGNVYLMQSSLRLQLKQGE